MLGKIYKTAASGAAVLLSTLALQWAFVPKWYQIFGPIGVVAVFGFGLLLAYTNPDREAIKRHSEIAKSVAHYKDEKFQPEPGAAGQIAELPSENDSTWVSKTLTLDKSLGLEVVQKLQIFPNNRVIRYDVIVPFQDGRWMRQSTTKFEDDKPIRDVLALADIKQRISEPANLICLGLSSRSDANASAETVERNEERADERASNLCRSVAGAIGEERGKDKNYWRAGLGYANGTAPNEIAASRQRVAIVIGVSGAQKDEVAAGIAELISETTIRVSVDLKAYSRSKDARASQMAILWSSTSPLREEPDLVTITE